MKKILFCLRLEGFNLSIMTIDNPNAFLKFSVSSDNTIEYIIENSGPVPDGTYDITVYAKEGFLINSAGGYDGGKWVKLTLSSDEKTAYRNNYRIKDDIDFMITTVIKQPEAPPESDGVSGFNHL